VKSKLYTFFIMLTASSLLKKFNLPWNSGQPAVKWSNTYACGNTTYDVSSNNYWSDSNSWTICINNSQPTSKFVSNVTLQTHNFLIITALNILYLKEVWGSGLVQSLALCINTREWYTLYGTRIISIGQMECRYTHKFIFFYSQYCTIIIFKIIITMYFASE